MLPSLGTKSSSPATSGSSGLTAKERLKQKAIIIGAALAFMWGLEIIDAIFGQPLNSYGVRPRTVSGLVGIFFAPVLHGDFGHLLANTLPFAVLGFLTLLRGTKNFILVTTFVTVVGGLCVWLIGGSNTSHIGASGLIFGYFGFIMAAGVLERSVKAIAMAVLVGFAYGGLIFGVVPSQPGISWEGHLFGFLAGVTIAYMLNRRGAKKA